MPYLTPTPTGGRTLMILLTVAWSGKANRIEAKKVWMIRKKTKRNDQINVQIFFCSFFIYFCWKIEKKRQGYWRKMDGRSRTYCGWLKRSRWPRSVADNGGWRWLVSPWNTIFHEDYRSTLIPKKRKRKTDDTQCRHSFSILLVLLLCFYFIFCISVCRVS